MYSPDDIKHMIETALPDATVEVKGADGAHFAARVIASAFAGRSKVEQHRMVYAALGDKMGNEIHALSLTTLTPEQSEAQQ